ncbi:MAG: hypothetical protein Q8O89_03030 [Nanoarchaeota archaeon]|nr:hypothetical protein [Nanoarchaeota archaeon]
MESPLYVVRQESKRVVVPEMFKLILLAVTMYIGIYMNFLILRKTMTPTYHFIIAVILIFLIFIQTRISHIRSSNVQYVFFQNRVEMQGDVQGVFYFANVNMVYAKKSFADRFFGTGTVFLEPGFAISAIKDPEQVSAYIQKLVGLARQSAYFSPPQSLNKAV